MDRIGKVVSIHHAATEGVLHRLQLESILLRGLLGRSALGDAALGDSYTGKKSLAKQRLQKRKEGLAIERSSSLPRRLGLGRALAGGNDLVLGAVANGFLHLFGLLLDWAEAVLDRIISRAEVSGDAANVDLLVVVSFTCLGGRYRMCSP